MRKKALAFTISYVVALAVRLLPYLSSTLPFSVDSWPLVRNVKLLKTYTPIDLSSNIFDGYNNYWPGCIIAGTVYSIIAGGETISSMSVLHPLASSIAVMVFYFIVYKISRSHAAAFISSLYLALIYPYTIMMAGVVKESYASPLLMTLLYFSIAEENWLGFAITGAALVITHHLTTAIAITILSVNALASSFEASKDSFHASISLALQAMFLAAGFTIHYIAFGSSGLQFNIGEEDLVSLFSHQLLFFLIFYNLLYRPKKYSKKFTIINFVIAQLLAICISLLVISKSILPGIPPPPIHYLIYETPYLLASPFLVLAYAGYLEKKWRQISRLFFWLSAVIGILSFAVFSGTYMGSTLAYRTVCFLAPPFAALFATGICWTWKKVYKYRIARIWLCSITIAVLALSLYTFNACIFKGERFLGSFWLYKQGEYALGEWLWSLIGNLSVAGDVKTAYLLKGLYGVEVDTARGYDFLKNKKGVEILVASECWSRLGYFIGPYGLEMPNGWREKLSSINKIYSNGFTEVFKGKRGNQG